MQNIILKGMLNDFAARNGFGGEAEDQQFEKFCNYCILSNDHYDSFDFEKVATGTAQGVDGVAVVIGDVITDEVEDANHFTKSQFSASFHFVQAKTSQSFSLGDFLKFTSIVRAFFKGERDALPAELKNSFDIKKIIYDRAGKLSSLPTLALSYAYTGDFKLEPGPTRTAIENEIAALRAEKYMFSDVTLSICDGAQLADMYREAQNNIVGQVSFQRHVALPQISKATAAYIGVIKCKDYIQLIRKTNGEINKGLFYENVRDFLGARNPVNRDIGETISSAVFRDQFALLNNGVTLVAKKVVPSGDTFELHRFQVVNGCQTSHVLFNGQHHLSDDMYVTVKLIETDDVDLTNSVIRSTNSQSVVMKEAFATIRPYHRVLEDYFAAMRSDGFKFYYERRPHQFDDIAGITQDKIVSAPNLMKSFVSVVLDEPHKVHYYYGRLLEEYNNEESNELFSEDDYPGLYFASHVIAAKVREITARDRAATPWAYHIAMLVKKILAPELVRGTTFKDKQFLPLLTKIDSQFGAAFSESHSFITKLRLTRHDNRLPKVTARMLSEFKPKQRVPAKSSVKASADQDGTYVGRFERHSEDGKKMLVRYGSQLVEMPLPSSSTQEVIPGALVRYTKVNGSVSEVVLI